MCLETSWRWPRLVTVSLALCRDCGCDYGYSYGCGYFAHECGLIDDLSRPSTLFPWIEYRTSGCRGGLSSHRVRRGRLVDCLLCSLRVCVSSTFLPVFRISLMAGIGDL